MWGLKAHCMVALHSFSKGVIPRLPNHSVCEAKVAFDLPLRVPPHPCAAAQAWSLQGGWGSSSGQGGSVGQAEDAPVIVFDHEDGPVRSEAGFNQRRNNSRVGVARRVEQDKGPACTAGGGARKPPSVPRSICAVESP